ncbi:MAG: hypothetical protein GY699_00420 [Desulfobacteraceae bacterium]|nr:hypothetical protein [Desulfobacteraceae bacterium]
MTKEIYDYDVRCNTCFNKFKVQLFESHEKNLWLVDKKDWYCETCKNEYFEKQTAKLAKSHAEIGFPELNGTPKRISWAEKIRAELINKVDFLKKSLVFNDDKEKEISDMAFNLFLQEWQKETDAKWWIDNRNKNVRAISDRIKEITESIK